MPNLDPAIKANIEALLHLLRTRIGECDCLINPRHNDDDRRLLCDRCQIEGPLARQLYDLLHHLDPARRLEDEPWVRMPTPPLTLVHDDGKDH